MQKLVSSADTQVSFIGNTHTRKSEEPLGDNASAALIWDIIAGKDLSSLELIQVERQPGRQEAQQPLGCCLVCSHGGATPCDLRSSVHVSKGDPGQ